MLNTDLILTTDLTKGQIIQSPMNKIESYEIMSKNLHCFNLVTSSSKNVGHANLEYRSF